MEKMISIPAARFAADEDAALKAKREELKKKLLAGKKVIIAPDGNVTKEDDTSSIVIPKGKLAGDSSEKNKIKWGQLLIGVLLLFVGVCLFCL